MRYRCNLCDKKINKAGFLQVDERKELSSFWWSRGDESFKVKRGWVKNGMQYCCTEVCQKRKEKEACKSIYNRAISNKYLNN